MSGITVLRLSHRIGRDERVTTHVGLTARAFGAKGIAIAGDYDPGVLESLRRVTEVWGGPFEVQYVGDWREYLRSAKSRGDLVVHLTMYGVPLPEVLEELRRALSERNMVVVVGSSKVPREVYELADLNVSIGNQPHSEVAALAVFLDRLLDGLVFRISFPDARLRVVPHPRRKVVLRRREEALAGAEKDRSPGREALNVGND
ncbi:MAG: tRNA (cytidine(56)-2'-O)-methyltransferase [Nitrososphaerota archaeon]|nr:tRNA (cytidine(56)-2'-O)-methyltransferase [Candidatus Calditenuis fumarioli]